MSLTYRILTTFVLLLIFFFNSIIQAYSQQVTWGYKIGGSGSDLTQKVHTAVNGDVLICGKFQGTNIDFDPSSGTDLHSSNGTDDAFFSKFTSDGTYLFTVTFGGSNLDKVENITTDASGNIYATGFFRGPNVDFDPSSGTALLSSNGDAGGDPGYGGDMFVAKYNSSGQFQWAFHTGGSGLGDNGICIKTDQAGNVYVGGYFVNTVVDFDPSPTGVANLTGATGTMVIAKYNANGQYQWAFNQGGGMMDNTVFDMQVTNAGEIFITGFFSGTNIDFDPSPTASAMLSSSGGYEAYVAKYTTNGEYRFAFKIGGGGLDTGRGLAIDNTGNIYVFGDFNGANIDFDPSPSNALLSSNGSSDIFIAKYSNTGQYIWAFNAGSSGGEVGWKIETDNNSVFVVGAFNGTSDFNPGPAVDNLVSNGGYDIFLAKYDINGNYQCAFNIGSSGDDFGFGISLAGPERFYLTGGFRGTGVDFAPSQSTYLLNSAGNDDIFLVKYLWPPNMTPNGSVAGNVICRNSAGQLTFTATAGTSPFTLQYTDGTNIYTQSNVYSGVPFNVQVSPTVSTNYTVTLIQDAVRCSPPNNVTLSATITVDNTDMRTRADTTVCKGKPVQLTTSGASTYSWSPATYLSSASVASPITNPETTIQYVVTGVAASGCILKDTVNVNVYQAPSITISNDTSICRNSSFQLAISGGQSYLWSPGASIINANTATPTVSPVTNTMYYVDITDNNNCVSRDSVLISIRPDAVFSVSAPKNICLKDTIQLNASGGDVYLWQPAGSLTDNTSSSPSAFPIVPTTYTVTIRESVCNQSAVLSTLVTPLDLPIITAGKSNDIDCTVGTSVLNATGGNRYSWTPALYLNNSSIRNPTAFPSLSTDFIVKGTDLNGCSNYDTIRVNVTKDNKSSYLMPTGFTPNNDGLNDCYGIKYWGIIQEVDFSIYNRWGQRIFYSNNPNACWDGRFKGVVQSSDVFVYVIKAKTSCDDYVFKKGTFTLIR